MAAVGHLLDAEEGGLVPDQKPIDGVNHVRISLDVAGVQGKALLDVVLSIAVGVSRFTNVHVIDAIACEGFPQRRLREPFPTG